jgi:uncharacterized protein (DUF362 family)
MKRRALLSTASLAFVPLGCAGLPVVEPVDAVRDRVILGLFPSTALPTPDDAIHRTLEQMDLSWLRPGDTVLIKVASNSANVHPATTSHTAVRAMCRALLSRGAGRVVVGDQCGVMSARLVKQDGVDHRYRSTKSVMEANGLVQAIVDGGGEPHFFDDHGFDVGYVQATMPRLSSWENRPHIPRIVTEVDHIVYLPRLSSHLLTGYTHGHKIAVGFMRDDTRHEMHADASTIYEKYTELNYCDEIRTRLRLVVTLAEQVMLGGGPDTGSIADADPRIVVASTHLANHDAVAVGVLTWAQQHMAQTRDTHGIPHGPWASLTNTAFLAAVHPQTGFAWSSDVCVPSTYWPHNYSAGVTSDRALLRAYEILGGVPSRVAVSVAGAAPSSSLRAHLSERSRSAWS